MELNREGVEGMDQSPKSWDALRSIPECKDVGSTSKEPKIYGSQSKSTSSGNPKKL